MSLQTTTHTVPQPGLVVLQEIQLFRVNGSFSVCFFFFFLDFVDFDFFLFFDRPTKTTKTLQKWNKKGWNVN